MMKLFIPVAAFALTAGTASAFGGDWGGNQAPNLDSGQRTALETAREMRQAGKDHTEIDQVLKDAGITGEMMRALRHDREHNAERDAIHKAVEDNNYEAFAEATSNTRLAEAIDSEAKFEQFVQAHELLRAGERSAAEEIFADLGLPKPRQAGDHDHREHRMQDNG